MDDMNGLLGTFEAFLRVLMLWPFLQGVMAGFFILHCFSFHSQEKEIRAAVCSFFGIAGSLAALSWFGLAFLSHGDVDASPLLWWGAGAGLGLVSALFADRAFAGVFNSMVHTFTRRTSLERNRKTDVREIHRFLPSAGDPYDPTRYFSVEKGFFMGLDETGKPVYWQGRLPHIQVAGTTGSGKGVFLGMIGPQCLLHGEAVFYIDPKDDEWGPHVLHAAAKRAGVPYHFVDLRPGAGPQINLFDGCDAEQIEELLLAGFELGDKGGDSDHYRLADRRAAGHVAREAKNGDTPASLYRGMGEFLEKTAPGFAGKLREMADIAAVNARHGINLQKVIREGGAVYVVGSMRHAKVVRLQRMLLVRLIQMAEGRDRMREKPRPICVVLDELKYHISRPALEALGAARDKGLHVVMAHQALGDLRDCPADLNPDAVTSAVMENGKLKLIYRVEDPDTAEWLARKSGSIQVDDESRKVARSIALVEKVEGERTIKQSERYYIDENMILNLPNQCGVLFGQGLPKFTHTSPYQAAKDGAALRTVTERGHDDPDGGGHSPGGLAPVDFTVLD